MAAFATDPSRFIAALTRHQPALEAFCYAQLGQRQDAQEVLQATCVKLWEKSADWDPETQFPPWAFAVARFTVLSHIRDKMRGRLIFDEDVVLAMAEETEAMAEQFEDRREALGECLQKVKPEQRDLLQQHYIAGRSVRELSRATGRSDGAVKMILLRLREQLSACGALNDENSRMGLAPGAKNGPDPGALIKQPCTSVTLQGGFLQITAAADHLTLEHFDSRGNFLNRVSR